MGAELQPGLFALLPEPVHDVNQVPQWLHEAAPSGRGCEWHTRIRKLMLVAPCIHAARWYRVNHLRLSLCICHASQMAVRKGIVVSPDPIALAELARH